MTNFIPLFPLNIVVYPGEDLHLHIFEPRYKQLITECHAAQKSFGIPAVINNKVQDFGTAVTITELSKVYDNGEMDIKTKGDKVFRILEVIEEIPDKLYSGAIVNYPDNYERGNPELMRKMMASIRELHQLLNVKKDFKKEDGALSAYDVAHHVGLSLEEEYELLNLLDERQRREYLKRHLTKVIPMVAGMEQLKEKIKLNGHFKNLGGVDLGK
ncbi:MAG: LON peptidase substrate-binding domain-containing protein [Chitinophagaceae bacterium]|nr:LON peptidase substrate-binding domain-containing protein [Chitinophagaceae bacterium]MBK7679989.1 LON peptidase substrate-binding domain-containing protein [Chitinophagaceae bacterium]MBK9465675.1 LON peptidase substrate-binding domain-containing protein [Chitinophagaceae bacterium]MBK9937698.1 LON peptidase substrate-binding domain-containing protein [Chitinophagaceae bacterium]MBL0068739.1 LON peptidase substrate-binding domain-containing protein [Chitinophagaceae bacterium]